MNFTLACEKVAVFSCECFEVLLRKSQPFRQGDDNVKSAKTKIPCQPEGNGPMASWAQVGNSFCDLYIGDWDFQDVPTAVDPNRHESCHMMHQKLANLSSQCQQLNSFPQPAFRKETCCNHLHSWDMPMSTLRRGVGCCLKCINLVSKLAGKGMA